MSDYQTIEVGSVAPLTATMVSRNSGLAITSGTVNFYVYAHNGTNAAKWWRASDNTWHVTETANAASHISDGSWSSGVLSASPFASGVYYRIYFKESTSLHVPIGWTVKAEYTPAADSNRRMDLSKIAGRAVIDPGGSVAVPQNIAADGAKMDLINAPNAVAIAAVQNGLATSSGLTSLQSHGDSTWATATGFSTFDPASDKVQLAASQPSYAPLLASGYTAPDNTSITAIKAKTDLIGANAADSPNAQTAQTNAATAATQATAANAKLLGNVAAQTGDAFARLGAPAGASVSADIAAVKGDTDTLNGVTFPGNFSLLVISADGEVTASNASGTALTAAQFWSYSQRSLTDGSIRVVNPLQTGTQSWVRGDSYLNDDGNARSFAKVDGAMWPTDLSGWTITFTCNPTDDLLETDSDAVGFTATGTVVTATGDSQAVRFDFTAAQTGTLTPSVGGYKYDVQASKGNSRVTLETGVLTVVEDQTTG